MGYLSTSSSLFAGILAYWKLDDISWTDSSSNGRNLTLVGSLSNPAGLIGNSASGFSGNDYLITPSGLAPLSGKRTYSCWVYFNSNDIGYQIIWGQGGTEDYQSTYPFIIETNNQITSWFTTENGYWTNGIDSGIIPDTDVWYHLVLTFDGSIGILYVNGTSVGSSEYSGSILAPDIDRFLFGRYYTDINYNDNEFNPLALDGKIDEVGVWDRALTQEEITTLYNSGAGKFLNGKISIKKQNLTFLKPYSIDGGTTEYDANAVYIFKGGSTNTVSTVFNYLELQAGSNYSTADAIYIPSVGSYIYYKNSGIGGTGWRTSGGGNPTDLVINNGDLIYFTPRSNKQISVNSGAIIQRYSDGKASLKKSNLSKLISTGSFTFVRGSNNTIATFSNGSEFVNNNNSSLADKISISSSQSGGFISYYLRGDGITWRRPSTTDAQNNTIIPDGSIILYNTYNSVLKEFTVQGNNIVRAN
jgi:hypothetical protein